MIDTMITNRSIAIEDLNSSDQDSQPSAVSRKDSYWDKFYAARLNNTIPSQFASLVLSETKDFENLIDCGCGDGRDSLFFAQYGKNVLGLDSSFEAIKGASACASKMSLDNVLFQRVDFSNVSPSSVSNVSTMFDRCVVYARFFIHAIDEATQRNFLKFIGDMTGIGSVVYLEFRTRTDEQLQKVEAPHFRRYLDHWEFIQGVDPKIFRVNYVTSGFGMAKYGPEDAHVARVIMEKA